MREERNARWEQLATDVWSGMKDWESQHPKATCAEVEEAVEEHLAQLRARMLEEVFRGKAGQQQMRWRTCDGALQERGKHIRRLTTQGKRDIEIERSYG